MSTVFQIQHDRTICNFQVLKPCGITSDVAQDIYIADAGFGQVAKFDSAGRFIRAYGEGEGRWYQKKVGKLSNPTGVTLDEAGNVFVADVKVDRIHKYAPDGHLLAQWGQKGSGPGEFHRLRSVRFDAFGRLWAVDGANHRVQIFDPDGTFVTMFGGLGHSPGGEGKLNEPSDLAFDSQGNVYVTDTGNHRVQKFAPDGTYLTAFGLPGDKSGEMLHPRGIAIDLLRSRVYVVDAGNNRIQIFDTDGRYLSMFGGPHKWGGGLKMPYGIAINDLGTILVTDNLHAQVMCFVYAETRPLPPED